VKAPARTTAADCSGCGSVRFDVRKKTLHLFPRLFTLQTGGNYFDDPFLLQDNEHM
jgi:hypothetical protein